MQTEGIRRLAGTGKEYRVGDVLAELDVADGERPLVRAIGEVQFYAATGASASHMHLVRHDVEVDLRVKRMMDDMCADLTPPDEELRKYYQENIANFMTVEGVSGDETTPTAAQDTTLLFSRMLLGGADHTGCYFESRVSNKAVKAAEGHPAWSE